LINRNPENSGKTVVYAQSSSGINGGEKIKKRIAVHSSEQLSKLDTRQQNSITQKLTGYHMYN
ncbi:Hypothetical predicted protein, partial [Podarcis lilfordi]